MKDQWYGDNRDLVKWTVLLGIAGRFKATEILQVLYHSPTNWAQIEIDGKHVPIPTELIKHFRDVRSIVSLECGLKIEIFDHPFANGADERKRYLQGLIAKTAARREVSPLIVFLDPDTGLEPASGNFDLTHVREHEVRAIWEGMGAKDILVLYQHQDNRAGREWIDRKRLQFALALNVDDSSVRKAFAPRIASDVVFYFLQRA
jgi:hypothetical protein